METIVDGSASEFAHVTCWWKLPRRSISQYASTRIASTHVSNCYLFSDLALLCAYSRRTLKRVQSGLRTRSLKNPRRVRHEPTTPRVRGIYVSNKKWIVRCMRKKIRYGSKQLRAMSSSQQTSAGSWLCNFPHIVKSAYYCRVSAPDAVGQRTRNLCLNSSVTL